VTNGAYYAHMYGQEQPPNT